MLEAMRLARDGRVDFGVIVVVVVSNRDRIVCIRKLGGGNGRLMESSPVVYNWRRERWELD